MAALSSDSQRLHSVHEPHLIPLPVKAATTMYVGAIACTDSNGLAVPGADTAGLVAHGVVYNGYDNSGGGNGTIDASPGNFKSARYCEVDSEGEWLFAVSAGAPKPGGVAYVVNDNTVSANATTNSIPIGTFTRPGHAANEWYVDVARR